VTPHEDQRPKVLLDAARNSAYGLQVDPDATARIAAEYRLVTVPPE
jgi:hypothetical protein